MLKELLSLFASELPRLIEQLQQALRERHRDNIRRLAHKLRGESATFGFGPFVTLMQEMEQAADHNQPLDHDALVIQLDRQREEILAALCRLQEET